MDMSAKDSPASAGRSLRFIIIGAGVSGVLAAIRLRQAGCDDFIVYEKAGRLGGTWRDNTYPGVACDIPSHFYSYSFHPNPQWSRHYSPGAEIQSYIEAVARHYRVAERIRCDEEVTRCEFIGGRWSVETRSGHWDVADVVIVATGITHHPHVPAIPGCDSFAGSIFHSARWNHRVAIDGQRVGIVGTGSTAVQLVAALMPRVKELALFQRTAQWILPQENAAFSAEDQAQFRDQPQTMAALRAKIERRFVENFADAVIDAESPRMQAIEAECRQFLESQVVDPSLREKLRPNYRAACKRLVISADFYTAMQMPQARLITEGIESIEPRGVRTRDGHLHELDVLVLATGFRTDRFMRPMEIVGPDGYRLEDAWSQRPLAHLCVAVPRLPNFFLLNGPNGPVGNYPLIEVAELQMNYLLQLIDRLQSRACSYISPRVDATARFEEERVEAARKTVWMTGCRSWYLDDRGIPAAWPWSIERFRTAMQAPRLEEFELVE
jgi:cation diffusion facilitator CzcD-associated flavoprotein CzcO